jgi:hypothetical protein
LSNPNWPKPRSSRVAIPAEHHRPVPSRYVVTYARTAEVAVGPGRVWAVFESADQVGEWSPWVERIEMDPQLHPGSVLRAWISTPLRLHLQVELELNEYLPNRLAMVDVRGDLRGTARLWTTAGGTGTRAELSWSLEMMHPGMRAMAFVSGPLLRWGHDVVAEAIIRSALHHLNGRSDPREVMSQP